MFSVIILYFTMYLNFNAHELTTIKSCCSFQYDDFSLLPGHSTSVSENTKRKGVDQSRKILCYSKQNYYKTKGEKIDYSVNVFYNENKGNCIPKPLFYAPLKHFESGNASINFFFVFSAIF